MRLVVSFLTEATIPELIVELQARGIDMSSAIEQIQEERIPTAKDNKIIPFDSGMMAFIALRNC